MKKLQRFSLFSFLGVFLCSLVVMLFPAQPTYAQSVPGDLSNVKFTYFAGPPQVYKATGQPKDVSAQYQFVSSNLLYSYYVGDKTGNCARDFVRVANSSAAVEYYRVKGGGTDPAADNGLGIGADAGKLKNAIGGGNCGVDPNFKAVPTGGNANAPAEDAQEKDDVKTCEDKAGPFGWMICVVVDGVNALINFLYQFAINRLQFSLFAPASEKEEGVSGLDKTSYQRIKGSWQVVSRLAMSLLVVLFLIMIIGQATSNLLDAYTVKKLLPRIIIAFILINLSWYIVSVVIEIGNIVGGGIRDLILAPFQGSNAVAIVTPGALSQTLILGGVIVGIITLIKIPQIGQYILYLLAPLILAMIVAVIIGMAFIVIRQGILILLAVFSPIAFVLWVAPGTQKYFDKWKDLLTVMVLFFPVFQAVIAAGALLAIVTSATVDKGGVDAALAPGTDIFRFLISVVCFFGPFFMIFKILEYLGSVPAAISGALRGRAGGMQNAIGGWAERGRKTTAPSLRYQTKKNANQERRTASALQNLEGKNWNSVTPSHILPWVKPRQGTMQDIERARQMERNYLVESEQKRLQNYQIKHQQALATASGRLGQSVNSDRVVQEAASMIGESEDSVRTTANALAAQGFDAHNSSTLQAIGNIAASQGSLISQFSATPSDTNPDGGYFVQNFANQAEAAGIATSWGLQARSNGQFSHDPGAVGKLDDLSKISASDFGASMERIGEQINTAIQQNGTGTSQIRYVGANGQEHVENVFSVNDASAQRLIDIMAHAEAGGHLSGQRQQVFRDFLDGAAGTHGSLASIVGDPAAQQIRSSIEQRARAAQVNQASGRTPHAA